MKKKLLVLLLFAGGMLSCELLDFNKEETDPEKTIGKPGNYWVASASGYENATITINDNDDGNVVASLQYNGNAYNVEGKITTEGIYDYVYSNGDKKKPFTLVKFDAEVGDKWEYNVGSQKVVRTVVRKSTEDDTPYNGFWLIKTIDVEEVIPSGVEIEGKATEIKKILWKFNHKFGFVSATITKTDNTQVEVSQYDTNVGN